MLRIGPTASLIPATPSLEITSTVSHGRCLPRPRIGRRGPTAFRCDHALEAAEKWHLRASGVKTPEGSNAITSWLKPRPTNLPTFSAACLVSDERPIRKPMEGTPRATRVILKLNRVLQSDRQSGGTALSGPPGRGLSPGDLWQARYPQPVRCRRGLE